MNTQVKRFDELYGDPIKEMNEFMKGKKIVDVKQSILVAQTGAFYSQYLVIYEEAGYESSRD